MSRCADVEIRSGDALLNTGRNVTIEHISSPRWLSSRLRVEALSNFTESWECEAQITRGWGFSVGKETRLRHV
jgi:hypothetical protein